MDKKSFLKLCTNMFANYGFVCKGNTYCYDGQNGVFFVFGLQKSNYGPYYYMEYGFAFSAINKHLPFPKHYELDINLGRVMFPFGKAIFYEKMDETECSVFTSTIKEKIDAICPVVSGGEKEIAERYIFAEPHKISYMLKETTKYFSVDLDYIRDHRITVVSN